MAALIDHPELDTLTTDDLRFRDHRLVTLIRYHLAILDALDHGRSYAETPSGIVDLWHSSPGDRARTAADLEELRTARRALAPYRDRTGLLYALDDHLVTP